MDETEAVVLLQNGDFDGLAWLVERFQLRAIRAAYLITGERQRAEDVVQSKFIDLTRSIRGFEAGLPFEPWFMRGVVNAAVSAVSRNWRERTFGDPACEDSWLQSLVSTAGPDAELQRKELSEQVWAGMQTLTPAMRASIVMRYYLEMSEREMAGHAGVARGTIKWRLNKAREALRKWFGSDPRKEKTE